MSSMNEIQLVVLFFAHLKEKTGTSKAAVLLPEGASVADLKTHLVGLYPQLELAMPHVVVAVNRHFAPDDQVLVHGAEVAFFPPVSGGAESRTIVRIITEPLNLDALVLELTESSVGAVCVFVGTVRGETRRGEPHLTTRLEYEAYVPMAEEKMLQIAAEIRRTWQDVESVAMVQRIGLLDPGTPTVAIICTAAHRDTGVFEACRYGIDRLKEIVPIWKKEIGPNGEEWVEGDYMPGPGD